MLVLIFVILLAVYTFSVVKIANMDAIINVSSELAIILFAIAFAMGMILLIAILQSRIKDLENENFNLHKFFYIVYFFIFSILSCALRRAMS